MDMSYFSYMQDDLFIEYDEIKRLVLILIYLH